MTKKIKRIIVIVIIAVALILTITLITIFSKKETAVTYQRIVVSEMIDGQTIEATGNIQAAQSSDLSFATYGLVTEVYVKEGEQVKKGQYLAKMDDVEQRYAYENAKLNLEQLRLTGSEREARLGEMAVSTKKLALDRARIDAPYDGFLSSVNISSGEYVSSGDVAMSIIDRSSLVATLEIDEVDLSKIKLGQKVNFEFDAVPGKAFSGEITRIPPNGNITNQGLAVFKVTATIFDPPSELLPAYSFSASIQITEPETIIAIPSSAVIKGKIVTSDNDDQIEPPPEMKAPPENPPTQRNMGNNPAPGSRPSPNGNSTGTKGVNSSIREKKVSTENNSSNTNETEGKEYFCYVSNKEGKTIVKKFTGIERTDGYIKIISGLKVGEIILVENTSSQSKSTGTSIAIPGLMMGGKRR